MFCLAWIVASALLLANADASSSIRVTRPAHQPVVFAIVSSGFPQSDVPSRPGEQVADKKSERLRPESRLELVRAISGEFARALIPLPASKKGFRLKAGEPVDEKALRQAVANFGPAANTGDTVQVTQLEFREREIVVEINGGHPKRRWRDRIQVSIGGAPRPTTRTTTSDPNAARGYQGTGAILYLDFGRPLPDLTPADLKHHLDSVLDFSKQRSAAVQWVDTLPPEIRKAIQEKRAVVGMDREMVIAAMGKPARKVRERDAEGVEVEDWIYGQPPAKTTFVRFAGERVISVKHYP